MTLVIALARATGVNERVVCLQYVAKEPVWRDIDHRSINR